MFTNFLSIPAIDRSGKKVVTKNCDFGNSGSKTCVLLKVWSIPSCNLHRICVTAGQMVAKRAHSRSCRGDTANTPMTAQDVVYGVPVYWELDFGDDVATSAGGGTTRIQPCEKSLSPNPMELFR